MPQFNSNRPYRIIRVTTEGVVTFEIHQPRSVPGPGGPIMEYEPVTTNPGNVKVALPTFQAARDFIYIKKIEGDGSEIVYDSEVDGV